VTKDLNTSKDCFPHSLHGSPAVKPGSLNTYLVTGGTGFLGTAIVKHLLSLGHKVRAYARSEHGHEALQKAVPAEHRDRLSCLLGAVEDHRRLLRAARGCTHAVHAAAQKVITLAEYDPGTCIETNIQGTRSLVDACLDAGIQRAVLVSTDKASAPATMYGASKLVAERLFLAANRYSGGSHPEFVGVRYGNVWASKGSVLEAWEGRAAKGAGLQITDPKCTRFHITRTQAVELVLNALDHAHPGDLWIPKLPTYRIGDLCMAFRRAFNIPAQPEVTGLRMAEKLHEDLISPHESMACSGQDQEKYILTPGKVCEKGGWGYSSGAPSHQLGVDELTREVELWRGRA
jgi:UDP-N-acetylglucosamine 4,6-dehydratase